MVIVAFTLKVNKSQVNKVLMIRKVTAVIFIFVTAVNLRKLT